MNSLEKARRGFEKVSFNQWLIDRWNTSEKLFASLEEYTKKHILDSYESIVLPKRATSLSAGYDIFSTTDFTLQPNEDIRFPLGWKVYMKKDEFLSVYPRSGLGFKHYTRLANTIGVIDSDYFNNSGNEGHCWIKIRNEGHNVLVIKKGEAVAQAIFQKFLLVDGDEFLGTTRSGGFGSTTE